MGITGLLPFIKKSCRPANLSDFKGATVAIDAYSWLHKGAFSCAEKLVKGEKTDGYVHYCMKQLNMLLAIGLKPIMVFDGCNLESKAVTEQKRRDNRERTRQKGKDFLCQGKIKEATECFQRCVDVTPEMAHEVIQACKLKDIDYIVAPYEADAQLAYLNKANICQIVITEDSDLVLFGCEKILFKMDSCGGGILYEKEYLPKSFGINAEKMSFDRFRYMCILSGCDYLPSLPGIGLAKACKFFTLVSNPDPCRVLLKLPSYLKMPKLIVSPEYVESFKRANNTFLYQVVFCPKKKTLVPLNPYPEGVDASNMEYAGRYFPDELALQIAMGDVNVKTLKKFDGFSPCKKTGSSSSASKSSNSIWSCENIQDRSQKSSQGQKTAFKFSQRRPKAVIPPSVKKRTFCETEKDENRDLQSQLLFLSYMSESSQQKKHKRDDVEESVQNLNVSPSKCHENTAGAVRNPFRKTPNSASTLKWAETLPLWETVRKSFLIKNSGDNEKQQKIQRKSVFDFLEREYQNDKQKISQNVQTSVTEALADSSSLDDLFAEILLPSTDATVPYPVPTSTQNSMVATGTDDCFVVDADEKENVQQRLLVGNSRHCVKPKGGYNLPLGSCGSSFNGSFETLDNGDDENNSNAFPSKDTFTGSPSSHRTRRPLSDLECDVLTIDSDSSEDCALVSTVKDKGKSRSSIMKKSSNTRCKAVGFSRNCPKSIRRLSIQPTLLNFKFRRSWHEFAVNGD